jgi:threonine dehydrogenase-like Zn-dependent dehydrogenase
LRLADLPIPKPNPEQVLIHIHACAVCRTDLHIVDGELTQPKLPLVPGHQIVGTVEAIGERVEKFSVGDRVGVPWLGHTCDGRTRVRVLWTQPRIKAIAVATVSVGVKTFVTMPSSQATTLMAAMQSIPLLTKAFAFPFLATILTYLFQQEGSHLPVREVLR